MIIISTNKSEIFIPLEDLYKILATYIAEEQKMDCEIKDYHPRFLEMEKQVGIIVDCRLTERSGQ